MEYVHVSPYNFVRADSEDANMRRKQRRERAAELRRQERTEQVLAKNALQLVYA